MNIIKVIDDAERDEAIFFLLTAYVEAVWHGREPRSLPAWVLRLPLRGRHDVAARLEALARYAVSQANPVDGEREKIQEALAVFRCAAERLESLAKPRASAKRAA